MRTSGRRPPRGRRPRRRRDRRVKPLPRRRQRSPHARDGLDRGEDGLLHLELHFGGGRLAQCFGRVGEDALQPSVFSFVPRERDFDRRRRPERPFVPLVHVHDVTTVHPVGPTRDTYISSRRTERGGGRRGQPLRRLDAHRFPTRASEPVAESAEVEAECVVAHANLRLRRGGGARGVAPRRGGLVLHVPQRHRVASRLGLLHPDDALVDKVAPRAESADSLPSLRVDSVGGQELAQVVGVVHERPHLGLVRAHHLVVQLLRHEGRCRGGGDAGGGVQRRRLRRRRRRG
mmetsp:Transcript_3926/g.17914  ORF Transcript_3926/g.17914 Transcript_3926/m.17914 type:complete len:289 (-) Transcript_3926:755-1621(-)